MRLGRYAYSTVTLLWLECNLTYCFVCPLHPHASSFLLSHCSICLCSCLSELSKWEVCSSHRTGHSLPSTHAAVMPRMVAVSLFGAVGGRSDVYVCVLCESLSHSLRSVSRADDGAGPWQIIMFSDLETDYINPIDFCNKMNKVRCNSLALRQRAYIHRSLCCQREPRTLSSRCSSYSLGIGPPSCSMYHYSRGTATSESPALQCLGPFKRRLSVTGS